MTAGKYQFRAAAIGRGGACLVVAWVCLILGNAALATNRALVIGVSNYPNLEDGLQLAGPFNDAMRVVDLLTRRGFETSNIGVLTNCSDRMVEECPHQYPAPTRKNILAAFTDLINESGPGDFTFLYFAGHGSQQPSVSDGFELDDGLDEIFLPSDVGRWDGKSGSVENAIVDDELAGLIVRLRNKGSFTWVIFDSCHAGTMLRAGGFNGERDRRVQPIEDLGIPRSMFGARSARPAEGLSGSEVGPGLEPDAAGYIAFYASQPAETTPELRLPMGQEPRQVHGLFTFTLMNVLESHRDISYEQALQQVVARYDGMNRMRPIPMYEGTGLDATVFANRSNGPATAAGPQWPIDRNKSKLVIKAGTLHDLVPGSEFLILSQPGDPDDAAIGRAVVTTADLAQATLAPADGGKSAAFDTTELPSTAYARLIASNRTHQLTVARPAPGPMDKPRIAALEQALGELATNRQLDISWVTPEDAADVYLHVSDDAVWLLPPSGEFVRAGPDRTPSVALDDDAVNILYALQTALLKIARVADLLWAVNEQSTDNALLDVRLLTRADSGGDYAAVVAGPARPDLTIGAQVRLEISNPGAVPVDFTVLFVDADWGISVIYPASRNSNNRLAPNRQHRIEASINGDTTGIERLLVIATAGEPAQRVDFRHLEQPGIMSVAGITRGRGLTEASAPIGGASDTGTSIHAVSWRTAGTGNASTDSR